MLNLTRHDALCCLSSIHCFFGLSISLKFQRRVEDAQTLLPITSQYPSLFSLVATAYPQPWISTAISTPPEETGSLNPNSQGIEGDTLTEWSSVIQTINSMVQIVGPARNQSTSSR